MAAALRWFGPLARWLRLAGPSRTAASQAAASQAAASPPVRPGPSGDATAPLAGAPGPHQDVSGPLGVSGPPADVSGPQGSFEGSADVTGPLVGIRGQSGIPAGRPPVQRDRPGGRRFGAAMRRLMVTPTFAAGLGVVVAASLAANMTKTVLHFSLPGGQCQVGACHAQPHGGTLASARPGVPITVPGKGAGRARSNTPGAESPSAGGQGSGQSGHGQVRITYQVTEQWSGGFADQITIGGLNGQDGAWSLAVTYPGTRIAGVQGAAWLWHSADSGVAQGAAQGNPGGDQQGGNQQGGNGQGGNGQGGDGQGGNWQGGSQQGGGGSSRSQGIAQFVITVDGQPVAPSGCSFDGERCAFSAAGPNS